MLEERVVDGTFTKKYNLHLALLVSQLGIFLEGTTVTWSSPMLEKLKRLEDNPLGRKITGTEDSWLASIHIPAGCIGAILFSSLASRFGRKPILIMMGAPFLIHYLAISYGKFIEFFYLSRIVAGFGMSGINTILPVYICELADVHNRGFFGVLMIVALNSGFLTTYVLGACLSFFWFHLVLAVLCAVYMVLGFIVMPESPHFLIHKGQSNYQKSEYILRQLRKNSNVEKELLSIKESSKQSTKSGFCGLIRTSASRRSLITGIGLMTFIQLTGVDVINYYTETIFAAAGGSISPGLCAIIMGIVQLSSSAVTSTISDNFKRKRLLIFSFVGVFFSEILLGSYFIFKESIKHLAFVNWMPLVCLIIYVIIFNIGAGTITVLVVAELFPLEIKGIGMSTVMIYSGITSFFLTLLFNDLVAVIGMGLTFCGFGLFSLLAAVFVKFVVVETKGKTLKEIQDELQA